LTILGDFGRKKLAIFCDFGRFWAILGEKNGVFSQTHLVTLVAVTIRHYRWEAFAVFTSLFFPLSKTLF
jgi:hypothetical protein